MVGVSPIHFDINSSLYNNCGWYFYFYNYLYSEPSQNFNCYKVNLTSIKNINDEIIVVMNIINRKIN